MICHIRYDILIIERILVITWITIDSSRDMLSFYSLCVTVKDCMNEMCSFHRSLSLQRLSVPTVLVFSECVLNKTANQRRNQEAHGNSRGAAKIRSSGGRICPQSWTPQIWPLWKTDKMKVLKSNKKSCLHFCLSQSMWETQQTHERRCSAYFLALFQNAMYSRNPTLHITMSIVVLWNIV